MAPEHAPEHSGGIKVLKLTKQIVDAHAHENVCLHDVCVFLIVFQAGPEGLISWRDFVSQLHRHISDFRAQASFFFFF